MRKILSFIFFTTLLLSSGVTMAIEEPRYQLIEQSDDMMIRDYAPILVAETEVEGTFKEASNEGFRRLAAYIFGKNTTSREIAMTAPVGLSEKIPMTAPVGTANTGRNTWKVTFSLPSAYTLESAPRPIDPRVTLREAPSQLIAVLKYSGTWSESRFLAKKERLLSWMAERGLNPSAPAILARFNPPWTPWFLRRNEVWIPFGGK